MFEFSAVLSFQTHINCVCVYVCAYECVACTKVYTNTIYVLNINYNLVKWTRWWWHNNQISILTIHNHIRFSSWHHLSCWEDFWNWWQTYEHEGIEDNEGICILCIILTLVRINGRPNVVRYVPIYLWHTSLRKTMDSGIETNWIAMGVAMVWQTKSKPKRIMCADKITECGTWWNVHCYPSNLSRAFTFTQQ